MAKGAGVERGCGRRCVAWVSRGGVSGCECVAVVVEFAGVLKLPKGLELGLELGLEGERGRGMLR